MKQNQRIAVIPFLSAVLVLLAGCDAGSAPLAPVHGKVSYKGAPLPRGTIVFIPDASRGSSGPLARADIQADGSYRLRTGGSEGAPAGFHRVTVAALAAPAAVPAGQRFSVPRSLLPEKYRDPDLSQLTCEVKPGKENGINFNLE